MLNKNSKRTYIGDFTAKERKMRQNENKAEMWFLIASEKQTMGIRNLSKLRVLKKNFEKFS
jgi:hypothetical protein